MTWFMRLSVQFFIYRTGRNNVQLVREKEVVPTDGEFVVVDQISVEEERVVLTEKVCWTGDDMRDNNGDDTVYGFVITGESWTNKMDVLFYTMGKEKDGLMKDYSAVVDYINVVLSSGGIVQNNVAVRGWYFFLGWTVHLFYYAGCPAKPNMYIYYSILGLSYLTSVDRGEGEARGA